MKIWIVLLMIALIGITGICWNAYHKRSSQAAMHENTPQWLVVIPGITGDLAKRKLIPALYRLYKKGSQAIIIGTGRKEADISLIIKDARKFVDAIDEQSWQQFYKMVVYRKLDPKEPSDVKSLARIIEEYEKTYRLSGKRLIYLSLPADIYCAISKLFVESGIVSRIKSSTFFMRNLLVQT